MFSNRSEYDHDVNMFSPEGRIYQVEYALEAIKLGTTAIGIQTSGGVVLAVEKRVLSPLLCPESIEKILEVDTHLGAAASGMTADARTLIDHARVAAQNHRFTYNEPLGVGACADALCDAALRFSRTEKAKKGEERMSRPYGVAVLLAGVERGEAKLYYADPSGSATQYLAKAIGAGAENAQAVLREKYNRSLTVGEAEKLAVETLKGVMEEKIAPENVEMAIARTDTGRFEIYSRERIAEILATLDQKQDA